MQTMTPFHRPQATPFLPRRGAVLSATCQNRPTCVKAQAAPPQQHAAPAEAAPPATEIPMAVLPNAQEASDLKSFANDGQDWGRGSSLKGPPTLTPAARWTPLAQQGAQLASLRWAARRTGPSTHMAEEGVDPHPWLISFEELQLQERIGQGSFSRVYLAKFRQTMVAVKRLLNTGVDIEEQQVLPLEHGLLANLRKEAGLLASIRHPNVINLMAICTGPPCVVTEYCPRGSIYTVLKAARQSPHVAGQLTWELRITMMLDAARGMLALHSHRPRIVHCNLNSPNILVDKHWAVKVADFSLAKFVDDKSQPDGLQATNPRWLAPEVLGGAPSTSHSDVFSFGVVLWEMLTWQTPFGDDPPWQVSECIERGGRLAIPERHELPGRDTAGFRGLSAYTALIEKCWAQAPRKRPSFSQIIDMLTAIQDAQQGKPPLQNTYACSSGSTPNNTPESTVH